MIVFSLLLILVAVGLLVLGLTGGSSGLLIASIVTSLLAAISLVIGARRGAAARRVADPAPARHDVFPDEPGLAGEVFTEEPAPAGYGTGAAEPAMAAYDSAEDPATAGYESRHAGADSRSGPLDLRSGAFDSRPGASDGAGGSDHAEAAAFAAGARDTGEAFRADGEGAESRLRDPIWADEAEEDPSPSAAFSTPSSADYSEPSGDFSTPSGAQLAPSGGAEVPAQGVAGAGRSPQAGDQDLSGALGEPDPEDPADEPRPQLVRPADAVRVAQLQDEVVVVDGRPRYHLADCPTLTDRETEPLPVAEAVALGFNPCGRCRPVDRLVAAAARH